MNMLRTSRIDPTKSAYHQLHGQRYDWNKYPLAPPGTRAIIYEDPGSRPSWGPRGTDAWYCGPLLDHYRNCCFYVPATRSYRVSGSFDLFPQHCLLPELGPNEHATEVYNELIDSIQAMKKPAKSKLLKKMAKALRQLSTGTQPQNSEGGVISPLVSRDDEIQRVDAPLITTSTNPTAPRVLNTKPRTHQCTTRANTQGLVPTIVNEEPTQQPAI